MTQFGGIYRGTVAANDDPSNLGRVQLYVPKLFEKSVTRWAPSSIPVGPGEFPPPPIPAVGSLVWVAFEGGDPNYPVYFSAYGPITGAVTQVNSTATLTVRAEGFTWTNVPYISSYLPTVNDTVIMEWLNGLNNQPVVVGREATVADIPIPANDVPVGAMLDHLAWPSSTTDTTSASPHTFIARPVSVVAGHFYLVTVRWVYTIVTSVPSAVTASITDTSSYLESGNSNSQYIYSANTSLQAAVGNVLEGSGSTVLQASATVSDTISVVVTVGGAGAARSTALLSDYVIVRIA